jgi:5-methylcytosine-specific restriction endonuclease McrA
MADPKYARYRASHKKQRCEIGRKWAAANPEKRRATHARYNAAHREERRESDRRRRLANAEKLRAAASRYRLAHLEEYRLASSRRRARESGSGGKLSKSEWLAILTAWNGLCAYCGAPGTSIDHLIPIARGGKHDKSNVVPACKPCNSRKRTALPLNFIWRQAS